MYKAGLAYESDMPINWCNNCKAVLANEEASNGTCDRCGEIVTKKMLRQWMLKITEYAERLLNDLDKLDWPERVKKMQSEWIGKSVGAEVNFKIENFNKNITVYTTRPDTLFGATFIVLAPEHQLIKELTTQNQKNNVEEYLIKSSAKSSIERMQDKEKTGVFTGSCTRNPVNNKKIPIWISDYVLIDYGTGAIMCVPAHDSRDFEFAKKFDLDIIQVISNNESQNLELKEAFTEDGILINSENFNGLKTQDVQKI